MINDMIKDQIELNKKGLNARSLYKNKFETKSAYLQLIGHIRLQMDKVLITTKLSKNIHFLFKDIKRFSFRNFYKPSTRYIMSGGRLALSQQV